MFRRRYKPTYLRRRRKRIFPVGAGWPDILAIIRNKLIAGVVVAIPLIVTIWVVNIAYTFVSDLGIRLVGRFIREVGLPEWLLNLMGFGITLVLIFFLGVMATNVFGRRIITFGETVVLRIPVIASIYSGVKQVMDSFKGFNTGMNFKRVVYVEYPSPGCRLIGFMTGRFYDPNAGCEKTNVFLPTSPNPMTGFILVIDSDKVINSDLSLEEASKMIFTAGLVHPVRGTTPTQTNPQPPTGSSPVEN